MFHIRVRERAQSSEVAAAGCFRSAARPSAAPHTSRAGLAASGIFRRRRRRGGLRGLARHRGACRTARGHSSGPQACLGR